MLPDDAVAADNRRWCVIDFPEEETVLVVDGDPGQRNAFYIQAIFEPGQRARTGVRPEVQNAAFLRDVNAESLGKYSAIYLFDVDRLDDRARENLEAYVRAGGGLAIFVGPAGQHRVLQRAAVSRWSRAVSRTACPAMTCWSPKMLDRVPDVEIEATDHPVFQELVQGQNPLGAHDARRALLAFRSGGLGCDRPTCGSWRSSAIGAPLVVEKTLGQGRVIAFLTTYAPYWNDMVLGPNVIVALRLQSYLGFARRARDGRTVQTRNQGAAQRRTISTGCPGLPAHRRSGGSADDRTSGGEAGDRRAQFVATIAPQETQRSGIYEMWFHRVDGSIQADRFAVNVEGREGDLAQTSAQDLVGQPGSRDASMWATPTNTNRRRLSRRDSIRACC